MSVPSGRTPLLVTAAEMAREAGIDPKRFRQALRDERLPWHVHGERWTVEEDSPQHTDMIRVLERHLSR